EPELQASLTDGYTVNGHDTCFNWANFIPDGQPSSDYYCVTGDPEGARTVLVIGDSHVIPYFFELEKVFADMGVRMLASVQGGCPPLPDVILWFRQEIDPHCVRRNAYALSSDAFDGVDAVVVAARWSFYVTGDFVTQPSYMDTKLNVTRDKARTQEVFGSQLRELQNRVEDAGAKLVLIQQPPYQNHWTEDVYARISLADLNFDEVNAAYAVERAEHDERYAIIRDELDDLARSETTVALSFDDELCGPVQCAFGTAERSNYKDHDHLSTWIGAEFADQIIAAIYPDERS
ncbi:MAG: SGNH hydrolase domain-containing protein, partial [Pseudomonadota bacterium]